MPSVWCIFVRRAAAYVEERRGSSGVLSSLGRIDLRANAASSERVLVLRVLVLPIVPNLVNHLHSLRVRPFLIETIDGTYRVMEEEHRI